MHVPCRLGPRGRGGGVRVEGGLGAGAGQAEAVAAVGAEVARDHVAAARGVRARGALVRLLPCNNRVTTMTEHDLSWPRTRQAMFDNEDTYKKSFANGQFAFAIFKTTEQRFWWLRGATPEVLSYFCSQRFRSWYCIAQYCQQLSNMAAFLQHLCGSAGGWRGGPSGRRPGRTRGSCRACSRCGAACAASTCQTGRTSSCTPDTRPAGVTTER